jgi:hypothetical protein
VLGCVVRFSIVWCTGQSVLLLSRWTLFMHCVLWLSQLSSALCWRLLMWVWSKSVKGGVHSQEWSTVGRSKMERHETNMYGWLGENTCRGAGRLHLMASLHFLSFTTAHSEGGLEIGMRGLWFDVVSRKGFLDGFPGWLWHRSYPQFVWSRLSRGKGFCEYGPLAGNVCVIHTIPNSFFLSD